MGQSAEELRREIDATRGNLSGTVDAIGDRVSPGRILERKTNRTREGIRSVRESVMGPAQSAAGAVSERTSSAAGSVTDAAGGAVGRLREAPSSARDAAIGQAQGAPLAAGLVAFGAGLLAAAIFKATQAEGKVAQAAVEAAQPLKEAAVESGQQVAAGLKEDGQQAVEQVKEAATSAAQEVKGTALESAQQTVGDEPAGRPAGQRAGPTGRRRGQGPGIELGPDGPRGHLAATPDLATAPTASGAGVPEAPVRKRRKGDKEVSPPEQGGRTLRRQAGTSPAPGSRVRLQATEGAQCLRTRTSCGAALLICQACC
jgi:hypothetical protein